MKKVKFLILTAFAFIMILGLCACGGNEEENIPSTQYFTVTFDTWGGSEIESLKIAANGKISEPAAPERDNYIFDGWTYNSKDWSFEIDTVKEDMTLTAKWLDAKTVFDTEAIDGGLKITKLKRDLSTLRVPSVIGGVPVIALGDNAFENINQETTKRIVVAASVTSVGKQAFKNCGELELEINGELINIGEQAFEKCTGLKSIKLGEGLTLIPFEAFKGCTSLTELVFPKSLTVLGENALEDCSALKTLVMHNTLKTVEDGVFSGDGALAAIYFYGTAKEAEAISVADGNDSLVSVIKNNLYLYSETEPTTEGKFWYFSDKGKIRIWSNK